MNLPSIPDVCSPCPLISKLNFPHPTPDTRRCVEIIEKSRHIWGYLSPEEQSVCYEIVDGEEVPKKFSPYPTLKLVAVRSIQTWYTEHSDLFSASYKPIEAIKEAVRDARRYARPGIQVLVCSKSIPIAKWIRSGWLSRH